MSTPSTGRGGRSRIVIDVEKARRESAGRRRAGGAGRGRKVLLTFALVAAALFVAVAAGAYFLWSGYKRSPEYTLALLVDAAQREDLQTIEQLLDADAIAQNLAPQVVEKLMGGAAAVQPAAAAAARPQLEAALPQLVPRVREGVRDEVARGVKAASENLSGRVPFFVLALGMKRYANVREAGDAASVNLDAEGRAMELGMRRDGDRWKVTSIKDDALVASIAARIAPALPAPRPAPTPTPRGRLRRNQ